MNLPRYLLSSSPEIPGGELIIGTFEPYPVFRTVRFDEGGISGEGSVPGYRIVLQAYATLSGAGWENVSFEAAAMWYLRNKVEVKPGFFKKWKI